MAWKTFGRATLGLLSVAMTACSGEFSSGFAQENSSVLGSVDDTNTTSTPTSGPSGTVPFDPGATSAPPGAVTAGLAPALPFQPLSLTASTSKVKALLTNLVPTANEMAQVTANPNALRTLITQWMQTPQYAANRRAFFQQAFQQKPVNRNGEVFVQFGPPNGYVMDAVDESFARTAEYIVDSGKPFSETASTQSFMMTTSLMMFYAMQDLLNVTSINGVTSVVPSNFGFTIQSTDGSATIEQILDPTSPHYMQWYDPSLTQFTSIAPVHSDPFCLTSNKTLPINTSNAPDNSRGASRPFILYEFLNNERYQTVSYDPNFKTGIRCFFPGNHPSFHLASDDTDWRLVTIRKPNPGEATTAFYNLPGLRTSNEMVLNTPRVGYFTTPAFFAQWATNLSNTFRSITNQTMIVGLNEAFDGSTLVTPGMNLAALDPAHTPSESACYSCHQTMDPMRQFFAKELNTQYSPFPDPSMTSIDGWFDFKGTSVGGTSLHDLGTQIAAHPRFAIAWTQKLCTYMNSVPCDPSDPEVARIANVFAASNMSYNALVVEMLSSPLVTSLAPTQTAQTVGQVVSVTRQSQLCGNLSARLNVPDICGLATSNLRGTLQKVQALASGLPADAYSRGVAVPPLVTSPGLVFRSTMENLCFQLATYLVDNGTATVFSSSQASTAVGNMTTEVMGLVPGSAAPVTAMLQSHYNRAIQAGGTPTLALQSTFMLACLSPSALSVGGSL